MIVEQFEKDLLAEEVLRVMKDLPNKGYAYLGASTQSMPAIGDYWEAVFHSPKRNRYLRIAYIPPRGGTHPDALVVHVENGRTDSFSIADFLAYTNAPREVIQSVTLGSYQGTFSDRIGACLAAIKKAIDCYLGKVIEGTGWTHVPIDWGGHK